MESIKFKEVEEYLDGMCRNMRDNIKSEIAYEIIDILRDEIMYESIINTLNPNVYGTNKV